MNVRYIIRISIKKPKAVTDLFLSTNVEKLDETVEKWEYCLISELSTVDSVDFADDENEYIVDHNIPNKL